MQRAILIDLNKCIGCGSCIVACKQENGLALGEYWTHIHEVGPLGKYPDVESLYYVPVMCQHCENPPCVLHCPTGASYKAKDGTVLIDHDKCVGCQYCIMHCPYGVRTFDPKKGVVDKCNLCAERVEAGVEPACVDICVNKARIFGDIDDPNSEISQAIQAGGGEVYQLKPSAGTNPSVRYLLKDWEWRGQ